MAAPKKRPVELAGRFTYATRKRRTLDHKGYAIDIAIIMETKTGRPVHMVMDMKTFKSFVIEATADMYALEHGDKKIIAKPDGLIVH